MTDHSARGPNDLTARGAAGEAPLYERAVRTWDLPVVHALDLIETFPGFDPDRVTWDHFRFWSMGSIYRMDWVTIYAYPPLTQPPAHVRFAAYRDGSTVTGSIDAPLSVDDVARRLAVPIESAQLATVALHTALTASLTESNAAHAPGAVIRGVQLPPARRQIGPPPPAPPGIDL